VSPSPPCIISWELSFLCIHNVRKTCMRGSGGSMGKNATDAYDVGDDITTPQKQVFMMLTPPPDRKHWYKTTTSTLTHSLYQEHNLVQGVLGSLKKRKVLSPYLLSNVTKHFRPSRNTSHFHVPETRPFSKSSKLQMSGCQTPVPVHVKNRNRSPMICSYT
jgi:hypothetical protein